ncbi:MAG TPA: hypothetical protein VH105_15675 [Burkholderiales bacterium]|jgi:hypothetical protein|nr:hypothetical protein [Burkholderiales bacterium]
MSANYREHKQERDLKRRVASLEARVVWLEDVLARVLGQPAAEAANEMGQAQSPATSAALDRFLLRTQPMSALAWPLLATSHGELVALRPQAGDAAPEPMLPFLAYPVGEGDVFIPSPQEAPAALAAATPAPMFDEIDLAPAPVPAGAAPSRPAFDLGITAAFETLEGKVAEAAVAELAGVRKRGFAAPSIDLSPDLPDPPAPAPPRRLEVCCALELLNPSILQQVTAFWSTAECELRLKRLIGEDFGGRMGLDPTVREELMLLCAISAGRAA